MRYDAKERIRATKAFIWKFESMEPPIQPTSMILIRITVAKVLKSKKIETIVRAVAVVQNDSN
jgi:hypothetical protein